MGRLLSVNFLHSVNIDKTQRKDCSKQCLLILKLVYKYYESHSIYLLSQISHYPPPSPKMSSFNSTHQMSDVRKLFKIIIINFKSNQIKMSQWDLAEFIVWNSQRSIYIYKNSLSSTTLSSSYLPTFLDALSSC